MRITHIGQNKEYVQKCQLHKTVFIDPQVSFWLKNLLYEQKKYEKWPYLKQSRSSSAMKNSFSLHSPTVFLSKNRFNVENLYFFYFIQFYFEKLKKYFIPSNWKYVLFGRCSIFWLFFSFLYCLRVSSDWYSFNL